MSDHKKHHFLPQFYLDKFRCHELQGKYPKIWILGKINHPKYIPANIKDTGCITDFHTLIKEDGQKDRNRIERNLSTIEGEQATILNEIINKMHIEKNYKNAFFINMMLNRVQKNKKHIEKLIRETFYNKGVLMLRHDLIPDISNDIKNNLKNGIREIFKINVSNSEILKCMYKSAAEEKILNKIKKLNWNLIETEKPDYFITSDSPVVFYIEKYNPNEYIGLLDPNIEVTFPLAHHLCLILSYKNPKKKLNKSEVKEYNRRQIINADKYIYSNNNNPEIIQIINRNYNKISGMKLEILDSDNQILQILRNIPVTKDKAI